MRGVRTVRVLGCFRKFDHLLDGEVLVCFRAAKGIAIAHTVSPCSFTHVSFMASCRHHGHYPRSNGCLSPSSPPSSTGGR